MKITIDVDLNKFRYSLLGDGYTLESAKNLTEEQLVDILTDRIDWHITKEYYTGKRMGLFEEEN